MPHKDPKELKAYQERYRKAHRKQHNEYKKKWNAVHHRAARSYSFKTAYGITIDDYERLHEQQRGLCALCGNPPRTRIRAGIERPLLYVDHDHTSGQVRGLLCNSCNVGIGMLKEDPILLAKAIVYLKGKCFDQLG